MNKLIFPALMLLSVACKRGDFDLSEISAEHRADTDEAAIGADEETRVDTADVEVETGPNGTRVKTDGAEVETGPNGTRVKTDGAEVETDRNGTRVDAKKRAATPSPAQANPTSPAETDDDEVVVGPNGVKAPGVEVAPGRVSAPGVEVTPNGVTAPGVEIKY